MKLCTIRVFFAYSIFALSSLEYCDNANLILRLFYLYGLNIYRIFFSRFCVLFLYIFFCCELIFIRSTSDILSSRPNRVDEHLFWFVCLFAYIEDNFENIFYQYATHSSEVNYMFDWLYYMNMRILTFNIHLYLIFVHICSILSWM